MLSDDMFRTPTKEEQKHHNPYDFSHCDPYKFLEYEGPIDFHNSYVHLFFKDKSLIINGVDDSNISPDMLENIELMTKAYNDLSQKEEKKEYKFNKQKKPKKHKHKRRHHKKKHY